MYQEKGKNEAENGKAHARIERFGSKTVCRGDVSGEERRQGYSPITGELVQSHSQSTAERPHDVDFQLTIPKTTMKERIAARAAR
jgi:hypothetical protein